MCRSFAATAAKPLTCARIDRSRCKITKAYVPAAAFHGVNAADVNELRSNGCEATRMCNDRLDSIRLAAFRSNNIVCACSNAVCA